jgi:hypothetical protein
MSAPTLAPGQTTNAQRSSGIAPGAVINHWTRAVSPGAGLARSGAPSTSTRAPTTRARSTSDTGSISGPQAAAVTASAATGSASARVECFLVFMARITFLVVIGMVTVGFVGGFVVVAVLGSIRSLLGCPGWG